MESSLQDGGSNDCDSDYGNDGTSGGGGDGEMVVEVAGAMEATAWPGEARQHVLVPIKAAAPPPPQPHRRLPSRTLGGSTPPPQDCSLHNTLLEVASATPP